MCHFCSFSDKQVSEKYIRLNKTLGQSYYEYFIALFGYSMQFMFHPFLLSVKKRRFLFTQKKIIINEFVFQVTSNICKFPFAILFSFPQLSEGFQARVIGETHKSRGWISVTFTSCRVNIIVSADEGYYTCDDRTNLILLANPK